MSRKKHSLWLRFGLAALLVAVVGCGEDAVVGLQGDEIVEPADAADGTTAGDTATDAAVSADGAGGTDSSDTGSTTDALAGSDADAASDAESATDAEPGTDAMSDLDVGSDTALDAGEDAAQDTGSDSDAAGSDAASGSDAELGTDAADSADTANSTDVAAETDALAAADTIGQTDAAASTDALAATDAAGASDADVSAADVGAGADTDATNDTGETNDTGATTDAGADTNDNDADIAGGADSASSDTGIDAGGDAFSDTSTPPECSADAACDDGNACTSNLCSNGACVFAPVSGPCDDQNACTQSSTCQGGKCVSGAAKVCAAPGDCFTSPTCLPDTGECAFGLKALGAACAENAGKVCDGKGLCRPCNVASDCPGEDGPCQTRTCSAAGQCGLTIAELGQSAGDDLLGDCRRQVCDGKGKVQDAYESADILPDSNPCTSELCTPNGPTHPPVPSGTGCGQNQRCDAAAACVDCLAPADCPGVDDACGKRTCTLGSCGMNFAASGSPAVDPVAGDCLAGICDGEGGTDAIAADDVGNDGNACTIDACSAGSPIFSFLDLGSVCGDAMRCDGLGACKSVPDVVSWTPAGQLGLPATATVTVSFALPMAATSLVAGTEPDPCGGVVRLVDSLTGLCLPFASALPTLSEDGKTASWQLATGLSPHREFVLHVGASAASAGGQYLLVAFASPPIVCKSPDPCDGQLIVSQLYAGGGGEQSVVQNDFVELHNRGSVAVELNGWSIHYGAATSTAWTKFNLAGTVPAGGYFLVRLGSAGVGGTALTGFNQYANALNLSNLQGKFALVRSQDPMPVGACPTGAVDALYWGVTNCTEATNLSAAGVSKSLYRALAGCATAGMSGSDWSVGDPVPRNAQSSPVVCGCAVWNESGSGNEVDLCQLDQPGQTSVVAGSPLAVTALFAEAAYPDMASVPSAVRYQFGFGPALSNAQYQPGWSWIPGELSAGSGGNLTVSGSVALPAGTYALAFRISLDQGVTWTLCDRNGSGSSGDAWWNPLGLPILDVSAP